MFSGAPTFFAHLYLSKRSFRSVNTVFVASSRDEGFSYFRSSGYALSTLFWKIKSCFSGFYASCSAFISNASSVTLFIFPQVKHMSQTEKLIVERSIKDMEIHDKMYLSSTSRLTRKIKQQICTEISKSSRYK